MLEIEIGWKLLAAMLWLGLMLGIAINNSGGGR
jgi:hypothetical protein